MRLKSVCRSQYETGWFPDARRNNRNASSFAPDQPARGRPLAEEPDGKLFGRMRSRVVGGRWREWVGGWMEAAKMGCAGFDDFVWRGETETLSRSPTQTHTQYTHNSVFAQAVVMEKS